MKAIAMSKDKVIKVDSVFRWYSVDFITLGGSRLINMDLLALSVTWDSIIANVLGCC